MARPIDVYQEETKKRPVPLINRGTSRSTARAFAAAISALAISSLIITTSSEALDHTGTVAQNTLQAGSITLSDDDEQRSLFDLTNMAPRDPAIECIRVVYEGSILPVELAMSASAEGELAPYLDLKLEQGSGGGFRDCSNFEAESVIYEGPLPGLTDLGSQRLLQFLNHGEDVSFRFRFEMADVQEAVGKTTSINFSWEVTQP